MSKYFELRTEGFEKHSCESRREGDWFIFECPDCNYIRRWNPKTKEMKVTGDSDENILHSGRYEAPGLQIDTYNPN